MDSLLRREIIEKWAKDTPKEKLLIRLFEKVRDIPYGIIDSRSPEDVYKANRGTCSGKNNLLKELYNEIGIATKDFIVTHRFKDLAVMYPKEIKELLDRSDIIDPHNFFKAYINGKWIIVDATWDLALKHLGFVVNQNWNGDSDMEICVVPLEIIETNDQLATKKQLISKLPESARNDRELFLLKLSDWLEVERRN